MCYGDDGLQHQRLPTSWWVSRKLADAFPLAPPMLDHLYMDNWWLSLAEGANCIRYFGDVDIEHLHPLAGKAAMDRTYERSKRFISHDRDAFRRWERRDRHRDVLRAKSLIGGSERLRVLADWHHPALWESLAILFEDRFGWELYSMGGNDWMQNGWTLRAGPPIGWSEADYLCMDGAVDKGTHHELTEREYPARPRKQVTVKQAQAMKWDFVLGSVPEHQKTFPLLAKSLHARFIHQVGNAKHPVDHVADQIVLASSNVRVRGRGAFVQYHQEFDRSVFAPSPITDPTAVTSLMLRLDWTSCDYRWLSEAKGRLRALEAMPGRGLRASALKRSVGGLSLWLTKPNPSSSRWTMPTSSFAMPRSERSRSGSCRGTSPSRRCRAASSSPVARSPGPPRTASF
jgi:uncharacterized protein (DUF2249 family)